MAHSKRRFIWTNLRGALIALKDQADLYENCTTTEQFKQLEWATKQVRSLSDEIGHVLDVAIEVGKPMHKLTFDELYNYSKEMLVE